jgi:hypothetical protein
LAGKYERYVVEEICGGSILRIQLVGVLERLVRRDIFP